MVVFITDQITGIRDDMSVQTSRFTNVWSRIEQVMGNFKVVDQGSKTQLQGREYLIKITWGKMVNLISILANHQWRTLIPVLRGHTIY